MKSVIKLMLIISALMSASIIAHPGGHGEMRLEIGDKQALDIVFSMTKALTFKDRGYAVGKLDASWVKVAKKEFGLVEESSLAFVYQATNTSNNQTLLFSISKSGRVESVKEITSAEHDHQH